MTAADATLAHRRITRAAEALRESELLAAAGHGRGAISRLYYAAFYAARALLALRGLDSSKHSGTIALFQQHFVKTGVVPVEIARGLTRAFDKRQLTDYADLAEPTLDDAEEITKVVQPFVAYCRTVLEREVERTDG